MFPLARSSICRSGGFPPLRAVATRAAASAAPRTAAGFHASAAFSVQKGDRLPSVELSENAPGNKVDLSKELGKGSGKAVVIGVPAAFSESLG